MNCFKSYDIRGKVPEELDEGLAYEIGRAYGVYFTPKKIVVGRDVRLESPMLADAVIRGLNYEGVDVIDIGICGTEEVYFHSFNLADSGVDGGIMITASHNPKGYNGMKMVGKGASAIYESKGLNQLKGIIEGGFDVGYDRVLQKDIQQGRVSIDTDKSPYVEYLCRFIDPVSLKPLKIVVNPGNGPAGLIIKLLEKKLPFEFIYMFEDPDGDFPNGVPNPMLKENQKVTSDAVIRYGADLGIAWDGDFDRCFFFDENGCFVEGYYIVGLITQMLLTSGKNSRMHGDLEQKGQKQDVIIYDPRLVWNTQDIVSKHGARCVQSRSGHSYIKEVMRQEDAIYGGEMSAHHYFRDFGYCDSGMLPWLLVTQLMCSRDKSLSELVRVSIERFPCSGEINFKMDVAPEVILEKIEAFYRKENPVIEKVDGISVEMAKWRFNIRMSNTEPLMRLNAESKGDKEVLWNGIEEIKDIIMLCQGGGDVA